MCTRLIFFCNFRFTFVSAATSIENGIWFFFSFEKYVFYVGRPSEVGKWAANLVADCAKVNHVLKNATLLVSWKNVWKRFHCFSYTRIICSHSHREYDVLSVGVKNWPNSADQSWKWSFIRSFIWTTIVYVSENNEIYGSCWILANKYFLLASIFVSMWK